MSFAELPTRAPGDWKGEYEKTRAMVIDVRSSPSPTTAQLEDARGAIDKLDSQLILMEKSPIKYKMSDAELTRRRDLVSNLRRQLEQAPPAISDPRTSVAVEVMATKKPRSDSPASPSTQAGTRSLLAQHKASIKEQDDLLEEIGQGVGRLKDQSKRINEEAEVQLKILDDLDLGTDRATASLQKEAAHANQVRKASGSCKYYLCIALLLVVLILLVIVSWGNGGSK